MIDAAIDLMFVVTRVASALTRLPASSEHPQCTAGMSFATVRGYSALTPCAASDRVLLERFEHSSPASPRASRPSCQEVTRSPAASPKSRGALPARSAWRTQRRRSPSQPWG
jgi:hypothetical protein